jgi:hypothetical protein
MNKLFGFLFLTAILFIGACQKNCDNALATCSERPPNNEACAAYFERWFYNAGTNQCELIGYSGCGAYGFATEAECQACLCD